MKYPPLITISLRHCQVWYPAEMKGSQSFFFFVALHRYIGGPFKVFALPFHDFASFTG